MEKMRVYELAKKLGMDSKEVIWALKQIGADVKNHMSTMDPQTVEKATEFLKDPKKALAEQEAKRAKKEAKLRKKDKQQEQGKPVPGAPRGARPPQRQVRPEVRTTTEYRDGVPIVRERRVIGPKWERDRKPGLQGPQPGYRKREAGGEAYPRRDHGAPRRDRVQGPPMGRRPGAAPSPGKRGLPAVPPPPAQARAADARGAEKPSKPRWQKPPGREEKPERHEPREKVIRLDERRKKGEAPRRELPRKKIVIEGPMKVKELAGQLGVGVAEVIKKLMALGVMANINQDIDMDVAGILAAEMGFEVEERPRETSEEILLKEAEAADDGAELVPRPPVVTVMGHVDHGKTSLLDAIRETNVTAQEAGGITQHIGAYTVDLDGRRVVFLDTPGHEAFTAMRARGARVTDIAVLVVAADDGVMPQTVEAINHARAAGVPILVAINKVDKPNSNPELVKRQLTEHGLVPEEWGGDTICVEVSARQRKGLENLLEMLLLMAEMQDLKANPNRPAKGTIIEAELDKGRGPVATVLVQAGTLRVGDPFVAGRTSGKVRAMMDDKGRRIKKATPSMPVEVLGFDDVPQAGDILIVAGDEKQARQVAIERRQKRREETIEGVHRMSLEDLFKDAREGEVRELNLIIKSDVQGSAEAMRQALEKLEHEKVRTNFVHSGVGAISESDVMLAAASRAIIIGFNVRPDVNAKKMAERENVDIRVYRVIYDAIDDINAAIKGLLEPRLEEVILGRAEVRAVFKVPKAGMVAGSYVTEGKVVRAGNVRIVRDGVVIHEGKIDSLKRFKDDVREVAAGFECGIGIEKYQDIKEGDVLEVYTYRKVAAE